MTKIFLISGLGADTRLYNKIDLPSTYDIIPVDWLEAHKTDTLTTYAQKLIYHYDITPGAIVIGTSLGGMIAVEIAKKISLKKTILISSIETINESPWYFKIARVLPVYKAIPNGAFRSIGLMMKPLFGKFAKEDEWLFDDMVAKMSPTFMKWAMAAVLKWDNQTIPPNIYHIHGNKDRVFPIRTVRNITVVKSGTHIMVFDKAKEISKWLRSILKK